MTKKLNVAGMSCSHCEKAVKSALNELEGVLFTEVYLNEKTVIVEYDEDTVTEKVLAEVIYDAGYEVV
ncbi:copper ion binding protein [Aminipila terrae]|uniref:Copper chaperone CopZ n=1 Tax=Aminipila terrae TaxID=2697030 RepID=A0A6P1ML54_9FIRM|nr:copper ion binding protein [Aminipila terrae]